MGANPCWTPDREYKRPDSPDAAEGLCDLCGGDGSPAIDGSPHRVCARCGRSRRGTSLPAGATPPTVVEVPDDPDVPVACPDDPGYVERDGVKVPERFARLMKG